MIGLHRVRFGRMFVMPLTYRQDFTELDSLQESVFHFCQVEAAVPGVTEWPRQSQPWWDLGADRRAQFLRKECVLCFMVTDFLLRRWSMAPLINTLSCQWPALSRQTCGSCEAGSSVCSFLSASVPIQTAALSMVQSPGLLLKTQVCASLSFREERCIHNTFFFKRSHYWIKHGLTESVF